MTGLDRRENYLRAEVLDIQPVTPHLLRVRFGGAGLVDFQVTRHLDQRVHIALPAPTDAEPPAPVLVDGRSIYPADGAQPEIRNYTVRSWDAVRHELTVDFAVHSHGLAVDWVRHAAPGSVVYLNADVGWFRPPPEATWYLLLADTAGLPALARILEQPLDEVTVFAAVEVGDASELRYWRHDDYPSGEQPGTVDLRWLIGSGNDRGESRLPEHVAAFQPPPGHGYVWAATECATARAIRKHVRGAWGMSHTQMDVVGYWRRNQDAWLKRYTRVAPEIEALWTAALADGKTEDEAEELCDEALERAGL
ncbi:MAG: siderophore-interacting protein [Nocardioides sp.]